MLYNADLLEITRTPDLALGFIDDIAYGVSGTTTEENTEALKRILERSKIWRRRHGAQFEPSKYMLVHFTRKKDTSHNTEAAVHLGDITVNPTAGLERSELRKRIDQAMSQLSYEHRTVLVLHEFEEMEYKQIAKTMGCSIGTVMSRLFYARRKLAALLADLKKQDQ